MELSVILVFPEKGSKDTLPVCHAEVKIVDRGLTDAVDDFEVAFYDSEFALEWPPKREQAGFGAFASEDERLGNFKDFRSSLVRDRLGEPSIDQI